MRIRIRRRTEVTDVRSFTPMIDSRNSVILRCMSCTAMSVTGPLGVYVARCLRGESTSVNTPQSTDLEFYQVQSLPIS